MGRKFATFHAYKLPTLPFWLWMKVLHVPVGELQILGLDVFDNRRTFVRCILFCIDGRNAKEECSALQDGHR